MTLKRRALKLLLSVSLWNLYIFPAAAEIKVFPGITQKIMQVTGERDQAWGISTLNRTQSLASVIGTDLGSSFEHNGRLVFLFGDTHGGIYPDADAFAFSTSTEPSELRITYPVDKEGRFLPIKPPELATGAFCVPSYGISHGGGMYVVYTQGGDNNTVMKRSFMIRSLDDGKTWQTLFQLPNNNRADPRFVNVALEKRDGYIWMFGSGEYRNSSVRLARSPITSFPEGWEYYAGSDASMASEPIWNTDPMAAVELFDHRVVGELSCSYIDHLNAWVMLYNSHNGTLKGVILRTAPTPWGPWSAPQVLMDPSKDGLGQFMHVAFDRERRDLFSDPGRENVQGDAYGPYLIKRFTRGTAHQCGLYYTLSCWNPYQVVLMGSLVGTGAVHQEDTTQTQRLTHDRWKRWPEPVERDFLRGRNFIRTHVRSNGGDRHIGWLWQQLPQEARRVKFLIHGGHSEVYLLEGGVDFPPMGDVREVGAELKEGKFGRIVQRAMGVNSNDRDIAINWDLRRYGGKPMKLVVLDTQTAPWGFVCVSDLDVELAP